MDAWIATLQDGLQSQATILLTSLTAAVNTVGEKSLAELSAILASYVAAVGKMVVSPTLNKAMAAQGTMGGVNSMGEWSSSSSTSVGGDFSMMDSATMDALVERVSAMSSALGGGSI